MTTKTIPDIVPYDPIEWGELHVPKFRDPERCWKFMKRHGFRRLPARTENVFLKNVKLAIDYAQRIQSRLPIEFENLIRSEAGLAWEYISKVIKAPMPEMEASLSQDSMLLVRYSKEILESRLPEHLEETLVGNSYACFEYAWQILDGRLPEKLHNYMFCAVMDDTIGRRYRGYCSKLNEADEYSPDYITPKEYFEFIKWQRKNLNRQIRHYSEVYGIDPTRSVGDLLHELEHGR